MHLYEVNFQSGVSPYRGDLIIPFREVTVRKLHKAPGNIRGEGQTKCHRLREFIASVLGDIVFFTQLGAVGRTKGILSVDTLITLTLILLEMKEEDFSQKNSAKEFVVDQSLLDPATAIGIKLSQCEEFNHFLVQRGDDGEVPPLIAGHYCYLKNPLFSRVQ